MRRRLIVYLAHSEGQTRAWLAAVPSAAPTVVPDGWLVLAGHPLRERMDDDVWLRLGVGGGARLDTSRSL